MRLGPSHDCSPISCLRSSKVRAIKRARGCSTVMVSAIDELLSLMRALRDPETGCPWDRAQNYQSLVPYTLEEAYEVSDAIERDALDTLPDELGDLLFQVVFYAQIAHEEGRFDFDEVARRIHRKLTRRHPHVFGSESRGAINEQPQRWEALKAQERAAAGVGDRQLAGVALALPSMSRAVKLQKRAARVGFDWADPRAVLAKVAEEVRELEAAFDSGANREDIIEEFGDVMFALANFARHLEFDPEQAGRSANKKFERRFRFIEDALGCEGKSFSEVSLNELDALWEAAKHAERARR